jgi:hypothetical protein
MSRENYKKYRHYHKSHQSFNDYVADWFIDDTNNEEDNY